MAKESSQKKVTVPNKLPNKLNYVVFVKNESRHAIYRVEGVSPSNRGQAFPERSRGNARDTVHTSSDGAATLS